MANHRLLPVLCTAILLSGCARHSATAPLPSIRPQAPRTGVPDTDERSARRHADAEGAATRNRFRNEAAAHAAAAEFPTDRQAAGTSGSTPASTGTSGTAAFPIPPPSASVVITRPAAPPLLSASTRTAAQRESRHSRAWLGVALAGIVAVAAWIAARGRAHIDR
jgi:hypothetical protein